MRYCGVVVLSCYISYYVHKVEHGTQKKSLILGFEDYSVNFQTDC